MAKNAEKCYFGKCKDSLERVLRAFSRVYRAFRSEDVVVLQISKQQRLFHMCSFILRAKEVAARALIAEPERSVLRC